jgi:hypothetical protein
MGLRWVDRSVYGLIHNGGTGQTHVSSLLGYTNSGNNYAFGCRFVPGTGMWCQLSKSDVDYTAQGYGNAVNNTGAWITAATHGTLTTSVSANTTLRVRSTPTIALDATKTREFSNLWVHSANECSAYPWSF